MIKTIYAGNYIRGLEVREVTRDSRRVVAMQLEDVNIVNESERDKVGEE